MAKPKSKNGKELAQIKLKINKRQKLHKKCQKITKKEKERDNIKSDKDHMKFSSFILYFSE